MTCLTSRLTLHQDHMGRSFMNQEGLGRLFVWLNDGPFPEHTSPSKTHTQPAPPRSVAQPGGEKVQDAAGQVRHARAGVQRHLHHLSAD